MSGRFNLLIVLLALQLVIIAVVLLAETGFGEPEQGPFLAFEPDDVDEIRITGDDEAAETLELRRADVGWRLPSGLPADGDKIRDVLDKLAGLRSPWPVATSGGAAERFEVTADDHQRHVVLLADGDTVADLYLGTSPGYQQVHARRADDDAVYSVGISNYQLPPKSDDWLDKTLLQAEGEISAIERQGAWQLRRKDESWLVTAGDAGGEGVPPSQEEVPADEGSAQVAATRAAPGQQAADQEAVRDLARRLSELRITGVAEAPAADAEPAAVLAVTDGEGPYRLTLFDDEDGNQYRVRSDRRDGVFSLSSYLAEQLLVDFDALVAAADAEALDSGDASADEGSSDQRSTGGAPQTSENGEPGG